MNDEQRVRFELVKTLLENGCPPESAISFAEKLAVFILDPIATYSVAKTLEG